MYTKEKIDLSAIRKQIERAKSLSEQKIEEKEEIIEEIVEEPSDEELARIAEELSDDTTVSEESSETNKDEILDALVEGIFVEEIEKEKNTKHDKNYIDFGIKLKDHADEENGLIIKQFNQTYYYKHIKNPLNENTGYFSCHCSLDTDIKKENTKWYTRSVCLSKHYVVADIEKFVSEIQKNMSLTKAVYKGSYPSVMCWEGSLKFDFKPFKTKTHEIIINCLTGMDTKKLNMVVNGFNLNIFNAYDGRSSLCIDKTINLGYEEHNIVDYFTLIKSSVYLRHKGFFNEMIPNLENIQDEYDEAKEILIGHSPKYINEFVEVCASKIKDGRKKAYLLTWDMFPKAERNLYNVILLTTVFLNQNYSVYQHFYLRNIIEPEIFKAYKIHEKKKNA